MDNELQPTDKRMEIQISDEIAEGVYSNLAIITHSATEFCLDFVRVMPGVEKAKVKSRIVLTPEHAKRLLKALKDNIAKYENMIGDIEVPEAVKNLPPSFGGPTAQA